MNDFWFGSVHITCTCSHSGQCAGLLWDTLGYPWASAFLLWLVGFWGMVSIHGGRVDNLQSKPCSLPTF